ncbi:MAG TPA: right-handed parallel beta-helix repeat-containing protein [Xanthobacteraceae bacterium]|jgi:hypothetical protein|nr:right-handed parallel beta-helix repeat-containing protein [Xanthobacteraceae bacterium]
MNKIARSLRILATTSVCLLAIAQAQAADRTWVSAIAGDDSNPCTRTTPCQTLKVALANTAPGGEINILDSGGYGAVTISQSVSIIAPPGVEAGILADPTGIIITAGPNDVVTLSGLDIQGKGIGIEFKSGGALFVDKCAIRHFRGGTGYGIWFEPSGGAKLYVQDTAVSDNNTGISIDPQGTGSAIVMLTRVHVENNGIGIDPDTRTSTGAGISMTVRDSVLAGNGHGVWAFTSASKVPPGTLGSGPVHVTIDHSAIASNTTGIKADGFNSMVTVSNSTFAGNAKAVDLNSKVQLYPTNTRDNNGDDPKDQL